MNEHDLYQYYFLVDVDLVMSFFLSSNNILTDGPYVSSYWPLFIFQMNAMRKPTAIVRETKMRRMMMDMAML
jgi:hypothetical protein